MIYGLTVDVTPIAEGLGSLCIAEHISGAALPKMVVVILNTLEMQALQAKLADALAYREPEEVGRCANFMA